MLVNRRSQLLTDEVENEITLTAFRLLTLDLLTLFSVMNEGTINVLGTHLLFSTLSNPGWLNSHELL